MQIFIVIYLLCIHYFLNLEDSLKYLNETRRHIKIISNAKLKRSRAKELEDKLNKGY